MKATANSISMEHLLDRQANLWELRKRLAIEGGEPARRELAHLQEGPWITISKSLGVDWEPLAGRLADQLGWQIYDREILESISGETHTRQAILARLDEHDVGWLEDTLRRLAVPDDPGQRAFLDHMVRVIVTLGRQGRTILVGRGANWILDSAYGLRVRLVAPLEARVERVAAKEKLAPARARARIEEDDAARARFIRQTYGRDVGDPTGYDIVLNMGSLSPEAASDAALAALRRKLGAS